MEAREEGDRDEDYDSFLAVANFDLEGGDGNVSWGKLARVRVKLNCEIVTEIVAT
jgi:hypothetical protein